MRHPIHAGFTLMELMIVVVIIGVLLALLIPTMQDVWTAADHYRCTTNLFYLSQAIALRRNDRAMSSRGDVRTLTWPNELMPYLEQGAGILMCPVSSIVESPAAVGEWSGENGSGSDSYWGTGPGDVLPPPPDAYKGYPPLSELAEEKCGSRYAALDAGPFILKLSEEQFQPAYAQGWFGIDNSLRYPQQHFDCTYQPGSNPYVYYLCVEDSNDPVTGGSNQDFNDLVVRVVDKRNGTYELTCSTATATAPAIVSVPDRQILLQLTPGGYGGRAPGGGQITVGVAVEDEPRPGSGADGAPAPTNDYDPAYSSGSKTIVFSNYAMNADNRYLTHRTDKVALLDYFKYIFHYTDEWGAHALDPNQDGTPNFARHWGRINVLMIDGSIQLMEPADLDPAGPEAYLRYWAP